MKFNERGISGMSLIDPELNLDERGVFRRNFCKKELFNNGIIFDVLQGNISENEKKYTLRGLHYQKNGFEESKILTCIRGSIYNVVLDLRTNSPTFKKWESLIINEENRLSLFVPKGCANGFMTLENQTVVQYYMSEYFNPSSYNGIRYDDEFFKIEWPCEPAVISERDASFPNFKFP